MITAVSCYGCFYNQEVKQADKYIKHIFPKAEYYFEYWDRYVGVLIPDDYALIFDEDEYYTINGKEYAVVYTTCYKKLIETYKEEQEQLRLF